jgi:hypothetical protein
MPMLEQAMTPPPRWQTTQRSVHTAQPGMPDCVDAPAGPCGNSGAAGGEATGASAARAATTIMAAAKLAIERIDTCANEPCGIGLSSRRGRSAGRRARMLDRPEFDGKLAPEKHNAGVRPDCRARRGVINIAGAPMALAAPRRWPK